MFKRFVIVVFLLTSVNMVLGKAAPKPAMPAFVETTVVQLSTVQNQIAETGTLVAIPGVTVRAEIEGRITKIYFTPGTDVAAGTLLVEINPDVLKATLVQNQADLLLKQLNLERAKKLYQTHAIAKIDLDRAQADFDMARGRVEETTAQLRKTAVRAPFDGQLGLNAVNLGDYAKVGQDIVNLQSIDPIYVEFSVPEIYLSALYLGQEVLLKSDAYPKEDFIGKVVAFESLVNANIRSIKLRAAVPNQDKRLLPGTFAQVYLPIGKPYKIIKVPQEALVYSTEGNYVYRVIDGKAVQTMVILGEKDKKDIIIEKGLSVGDKVIISGQLKVKDGAPVMDKLPPQATTPSVKK